MINPTFKEPWLLHVINESAGAYFQGKKADVIILKHNICQTYSQNKAITYLDYKSERFSKPI